MPTPDYFDQDDIEILTQQTLFKKFYRVDELQLKHRLFAGSWSNPITRELIVRYRVAAALPYDPKLDKLVLIEQFRVGALQDEHSPWLLEMVAGLQTEPNESLEALAIREAEEEAGVAVQRLIPICDYWVSPGGTQERVKLFCAIVDASNAGGLHGVAAEDEDIRAHLFSSAEAFAMVASGRINNAATIIALQWLELQLLKKNF